MEETLNDAGMCIDVYKTRGQPNQYTSDWRNPVVGLFLFYVLAMRLSSRYQLGGNSVNDVTSVSSALDVYPQYVVMSLSSLCDAFPASLFFSLSLRLRGMVSI